MQTATIAVTFVLIAALTSQADDQKAEPSATWKAAAVSVKITPEQPLAMAGYAGRTEPAEGTEQDLFAKAIAIEDHEGHRVVFVTLDLIGVLAELRTAIATQAQERYQLAPSSLLMNASHTHCGPEYGKPEAKEYFESLKGKLVQLVGQALERLEPATLAWSTARASVAMNRRTPTDAGYRNHPNPEGPVDHSVPVLSVRNAKGELRAVVFGYACHNTTMGFRKWLGDYAGYAQEYFEQDHPSVTALFMMGCGGDQNPYPRSELKYAQLHGRSLATAIEAALEVNQTTPLHQHVVHGPLRSVLETVDLDFITNDQPAFPYPVQVVQFGNDLMLIALGSEVVVDYSLRLKLELTKPAGPAIWIAGYSNDYSGYIPSRRVLLEGGYEAVSRSWHPSLEERIVGKVHELVGSLDGSTPR